MKLNISYIDNCIEFQEKINVIEIENKKYLERLINDLYIISLGEIIEDIKFFKDSEEIKMSNKINIIINYFEIDFNAKKYTTILNKKINSEVSEKVKDDINTQYKKIINLITPELNKNNLSLNINSEYDFAEILKLLKIKINTPKKILHKLYTLIDIEDEFKTSELIVFINLKQFLTNEEIEELYKYSLYKNINILLIETQSSKTVNDFENKLIIDEKLVEYMI